MSFSFKTILQISKHISDKVNDEKKRHEDDKEEGKPICRAKKKKNK